MTFSGRFIANLLDVAAERGADRDALLGAVGLTLRQLQDETTRVEAEVYNAFVATAVRECGDPLFGLHAGERLNIAAAGLIAQIVQSCSSVRQALEMCCEFAMLGCRALPLEMHAEGDAVFLAMTPDPNWLEQSPAAVQQTLDGVLAFTLREYHMLVQFSRMPLEVRLSRPRPARVTEYERVFGCPTLFNCARDGMLFPRAMLEQPIHSANYELLQLLVDFARQKLAEIEQGDPLERRVRNAVLAMLHPRFPSVDQVAAHLNVSVRTLQRRLTERGLSFRTILDELRNDFALRYLRRADLPIAEVADLLNYSDSANFIRAFRRRHDVSPAQWRRGAGNAARDSRT